MFDYSLPIEDQLKELKSLGLIIEDEKEAQRFFTENHPYRLRGYLSPLMDQGKFMAGTTFRMPMDAYLFDQEKRHAISLSLERVEIKFKAAYCEQFLKVHGETDYLDSSLFRNPVKHKEIMEKADKQRKRNAVSDPTFGYQRADGTPIDLPIWKFVELLTIKDITDLYAISEKSIKRKVASSLGYPKGGHAVFEKIMKGLTYLRNQCAHGGRLYNLVFPQNACLGKRDEQLLAKLPDGTPDNSHLFGYILILKRILSKRNFRALKNDIISLRKKYPSVELKHYGFPLNWERTL